MPDLTGLKAGLGAVEALGNIGDNLTNAQQRVIRTFLEERKEMKEALDIIEELLYGKSDTTPFGDNSHPGVVDFFPRKDKGNRWFWLLVEKLNRKD